MLVDSALQCLGSAANVPTVTAAHVFIYDIASLKGWHDILVDSRQNGFGGDYQPKFNCSVPITHCSFYLFLEVKRRATDLRKF